MNKHRVTVCNIPIDCLSMREAVESIGVLMEKRIKSLVVTPNVDHIVKLQKDNLLRQIYAEAALVLPDGMPIVWASRFFGMPLKEKVSGSDLVPRVCEMAADRGYKVFLLGGRPGAAEKAKKNLSRAYPAIKIAGVYSPPLGFEHDAEERQKIVKMINDSGAEILLVGLGVPKQERWIHENQDELNAILCIGVGITIEIMAGVIKRAPMWMQNSGLEWFWRLLMEPKRLWKRYLIDDMAFIPLVIRQKFRDL